MAEKHRGDDRPPAGFLRELDIIGDRKRGIPALYPVSRSHWREGIRSGIYPAPVKAGKLTFWRRADILALLSKIEAGGGMEAAA